MNAVENTGGLVVEPDWKLFFSDEIEIAAAEAHWRRISTEMRERDTLSPTNGHAMQRLVEAYILHDRSFREVAENGAVTKPKRGNPKAIARLSPHFHAMRELGSEAGGLEAELGISPRRRSSATKVQRRQKKQSPSANYLKPVASQ